MKNRYAFLSTTHTTLLLCEMNSRRLHVFKAERKTPAQPILFYIKILIYLHSESKSYWATRCRQNLLLVKAEAVIPRHGTFLTALKQDYLQQPPLHCMDGVLWAHNFFHLLLDGIVIISKLSDTESCSCGAVRSASNSSDGYTNAKENTEIHLHHSPLENP